MHLIAHLSVDLLQPILNVIDPIGVQNNANNMKFTRCGKQGNPKSRDSAPREKESEKIATNTFSMAESLNDDKINKNDTTEWG